jgi:ATP-dependent helicase Lhr and Lhr-like helicase
VVATSSLELGIDMGAIDLVVQVESPPSVASGLQRIGRAGHQVGEISHGVLFPKFRADLLPSVVTATRMATGSIEELHVPANPLDVLAQQVVAAVAGRTWPVDDLFELVRRAMPFATLPRSAFDAVLDMLSGRYPSDEFAQLRPRLVWDRVSGMLSARPGAQRLAVTSGGTIPDRGLFGVFIAGESSGARVGELDEEMVYESRVGDVFALGATSWRIEEITHDRVLVTPAPGLPGRLPFWKGDSIGRPVELGRALGAYARDLQARADDDARARLTAAGLDTWATDNLLGYLAEQRKATGRVPDDQTLIVERFRDDLGDHRICLHSPYGLAVHAPWSLAVAARLRERLGVEVNAMAADDGIVLRIPETDADPPGAEAFVFDPDEIEDLVTSEVGGSALFAARFRECASRALLLPRRDPGKRTPLWQQRMRSAQLLQVTAKYGSFPIVLETVREVLQDVYDLPALTGLLRQVADRSVRMLEVTTPQPSPYAAALSFGYVAGFLYEGDAPLAERRAAALALDPGLLAELLGRTQLRELLEEEVLVEVGAELQRLTPDRRARGIEGVVDLLRDLGPMTADDLAERMVDPNELPGRLIELIAARRVIEVRLAGQVRCAVIEDASRLRDAFGVPLPQGLPASLQESVADPLGDLVSRYARTHVPFVPSDLAEHFGVGTAVVLPALRRLEQQQRADHGEFTPGRTGDEWCDTGVLRLLRGRSLATLREQVEPVEQDALGRFLPAWQHVVRPLSGVDGVLQTVEQLAGLAQPAGAWESLILPSRVRDYEPSMLDELTASGEVVWSGAGALPGQAGGWVALHPADTAPLTLNLSLSPIAGDAPVDGASERNLGESWLTDRVLDVLDTGGAYFFRQLADAVGSGAPEPVTDLDLVTAVWDLVWAGRITGDTIVGLRHLLSGGVNRPSSLHRPPRGRTFRAHGGGRSGLRTRLPSRTGPPAVSGRWSLLPAAETDATRRMHAQAELLLDRYGVVSRGAVEAEGIAGGFSAVYKVLAAFEQSGRALRGYYVAGLGAAQFGAPGAVDRLRSVASAGTDSARPDATGLAVVLAATDPANPYGAALGWPDGVGSTGHRPGRKPGALVALVDGALALYLESGGKTLLSFSDDDRVLAAAAAAVAAAVKRGALGRLAVEKADGLGVHDSPVAEALSAAGFSVTPRGLRLRG